MDRSLLGTDEIVAGRVSILDASRRNRNFKVIRQGAPTSCPGQEILRFALQRIPRLVT